MKVKIDGTDVSDLLLGYTRTSSASTIIGNVPVSSLDLSLDNTDGLFSYEGMKDAIFEVNPTDTSKTYYFKAYEMPESWDGQIDIKLYDSSYELERTYDTSLEYPSTIHKQLEEMQDITGVAIDFSVVEESILAKEVNQYDSSLSVRKYLGWIAELSACNVISGDEYGKLKLEKISRDIFSSYDDLLDYKKGNPYTISKVSFNDSIRIFEKGTDDGNTYRLDAENPYIINEKDIDTVAESLNGLTLYSVTDIEADYVDNLHIGHIIRCIDFDMIVLEMTEKFSGGDEPDLSLNGELTTENQESVGQKITDKVRIKKLQVVTDEHDSSLKILAKQQEDTNNDLTQFELGLNGITSTVQNTREALNGVTEQVSKINEMLDSIELRVQKLVNKNEYMTGESIEEYEVEYAPTLKTYPTTEFYTYDVCSDTLYCSDTLLCGARDFERHLGELAKNILEDNVYYVFERNSETNEYYWRKIDSNEYLELLPSYSMIRITKEFVEIYSMLNNKLGCLNVSPDGVKASKLYCC